MAETGLKMSTMESDTRPSDGGESTGDANNSSNSNPSKSQQGEVTVAADKSNKAAESAEGDKDEGHEDTDELFVAGGQPEWEILLALFSSNLCFATEGPGRNNDHYDSADDKEEKGDEGEGMKGTDDATRDQVGAKEEKTSIGKGEAAREGEEEKTLERSVFTPESLTGRYICVRWNV